MWARNILKATPPATAIIIAVSVLVFVAQTVANVFFHDAVTRLFWYAPVYSIPAYSGVFEPWRMLTTVFTHSPTMLLHILFNMYALWLFGRELERMIGTWRFCILYLFAGFGGSLAVFLWAFIDLQSIGFATVGASGAIFGIMGATFVAYQRIGVNVTSLLVLLGVNLAIGFLPGVAIFWQAHVGGLLVGAATMLVMMRARTRYATIVALIALALVLVAPTIVALVAPPANMAVL